MSMPRSHETKYAGREDSITSFEYPAAPLPDSPWSEWERTANPESHDCGPQSQPEADLEQLKQDAFDSGFAVGVEAGRKQERATHQAQETDRTAQLARALEAFAAAREQTAQQFEPEVVRLALAIAGRILRRESHTDPLFLAGTVRVALGQLASSAEVTLLVPPAEEKLWSEWISLLPNARNGVAVKASEGMRLGDCVLESNLGSVDLGVRAQLGEIERMFFESGVGAGTK